MDSKEQAAIAREFDSNVNMTTKQLTDWLDTEESNAVGQKTDGDESTGHESGRKIIAIREKKNDDLSDADYKHMQKVNSYVARHLAQGPTKEKVEDSKWRYSLMNWGHDPLKK